MTGKSRNKNSIAMRFRLTIGCTGMLQKVV